MNRLILILVLTIPFFGFGQGWEKIFGGINSDEGRSVQQTTDGGYIITGRSSVNGNHDVSLIKTDGNGDSLWAKSFGGINSDDGKFVQQTTDGGYIITAGTNSFGNGSYDVYIIKTDGNGDSLWTKTFGGTYDAFGHSIQQTTDGGYIITGQSNSFGHEDIYLIKTDGNGDSLWTKTFGGGLGDDWGKSVQQTTDGGYIITGGSYSFGFGGSDVFLIKTDGNGDSLWTKTFGGGLGDGGHSVQQTTDGGYIICGYTYSFGSGGSDVFLIKTDGNGDSLWTKTFNGGFDDAGHSVQQTTDGGYIITGQTESSVSEDVYLIKTDGNGDSLWTKTFGGGLGDDWGKSVQQTTDGGYIITGTTTSFGNSRQAYLIKTDGNGNITSTFNIPKPSSNRELQKVVDVLGREINPHKNIPFIEIYDDGSSEKKIVIE